MTEEEKKAAEKQALLEEVTKQVKALITDSQKENVTSKDLDARIEAINKKIAENMDNDGREQLKANVEKLTTTVAELAGTIKAMNEKPQIQTKNSEKLTFRQAIEAAIMEKSSGILTEKNDDNGKRLSLKDYFTEKGNKTTPVFTLKAVDMLESNIVQSNVAGIRLTELDPQRVGIPLTVYPHVMEWMPSKGISRPYMSVLVVYSYSDGSGTKTEGSAPGQSSFLLKTIEFKAFTIATYGTLSDETLDDLPEALDEIAMVFPSKIQDNIDSQILGTAGDDSTALAGLGTANKHTDYSGTAFAASIPGANMIDLIVLMAAQVRANKYLADFVVMNPQERLILGQLKDLLNNSISDRRITFDALGRPVYVDGLRIYESTGITADTMFVGDSKQLSIGERKGMTMEIGYNGTDLSEGQKTVVFKNRIAFAVRDKAAIVYSSAVNTDWNALIKV
jgi:hypothetical protein